MESKPSATPNDRLSFRRLREGGHRVQCAPWLVVYFSPNKSKNIRIIWNLSRKIGNSVVRNRLKRWCREFFRLQFKDLLAIQGLDLNLAFRIQAKDFYRDLHREQIDKELLRIEKKIRQIISKNV